MANQTNVVVFDATSRKHLPLVPGDKIDRSVVDFAPTGVTFNAGTGILQVAFADGSVQTTDLTILAADKFLSSSSYDANSGTLTLVMSDSSTYAVPLADLVSVVASAGQSIEMTGSGTNTDPLVPNLKLSADAGNIATWGTDSTLFVPATPIELPVADVPSVTDDGTLPTIVYHGGANGAPVDALLGAPDGWLEIMVLGVAKRIPYYN